MGIEREKKCICRKASTPEGKSYILPEKCKTRGCLGIFKIDEDPGCKEFIDRKKIGAVIRATRWKSRRMALTNNRWNKFKLLAQKIRLPQR